MGRWNSSISPADPTGPRCVGLPPWNGIVRTLLVPASHFLVV